MEKPKSTTTTIKRPDMTAIKLEVKKRSDKLVNYFLLAYFLMGLGFAFYYDTWVVAISIGGLSLAAYYSAKIALPKSNLYQYVLGVVLGLFMAQFIYQMHGMFEMHFFAFIGSAILITYQNWKLQIPLTLAVVVHHIVFGYLQNTGITDAYFTQLDYFELGTFIIHFVLAAIIFFICGLWGYQLNKYSEQQFIQTLEMGRLQSDAMMAVAEREQKEALAESNKRFTYAAQATSDAIWDRTYSSDQIFWSEGFRLLFGYEVNKETMSINFWGSKVHPDDFTAISNIIHEAKENPNVNTWIGEYRFLKANGDYAYVKEKAIILRDENGKAARTIGALQDITEIKEQEIALKTLNENLEKEKYFLDSLMDNMPDSIYFKDRESRFIRVSKFLANKFGKPVSEVLGKTDFDFHEHSKAQEAFNDEQTIQNTRTPKIDYIERSVKQNGIEQWVTTTKMPLINSRNELMGTFGMSRDITKVKMLEEERHAALLEKAVAQGKYEIASDVMHDIGNAVVGFGSYLTRIRRLLEKDKPENLVNLARFFEENKPAITGVIGEAKAGAIVKMLAGIALTQRSNNEEFTKSISEQFNIITHIQEILDIQRQYVAGHNSQERTPVNLRSIINDSTSMIFAVIDKAAISLTLDIEHELPIIKGDRTKLMQAVLNLLKNAIEAIDVNSGEKNITIKAYTVNDQLVIEVKDTGNGFDTTIAKQLFTRGFTTKSSGSGLGLYNCRSIIDTHEGIVELNSEGPGKGAVAKICFKLAKVA